MCLKNQHMKTSFFIALFSYFVVGHSQIPTDNLLLYIPFNGNANDASGNSLNGTVSGPMLTEDRGGNTNSAMDFDGIDDVVTIPYSPLLDLEFPFSVSIWFYRNIEADDIQMLFKSDANDLTYSGYWINMAASGQVVAAYGNGAGFGVGARVSKKSTDPLSIGEWHHVVGVFNGLNDIDLYINCVLDPGSYSGTAASMSYLGEDSKIGRYDWRSFTGKLDDLRIYSDALTAEEIASICIERPNSQNMEIESEREDKLISIFPNPVNDILNVQLSTNDKDIVDYNIQIIDPLGRLIHVEKATTSLVEISLKDINIANGMYIFNIVNSFNEIIVSEKILLDR